MTKQSLHPVCILGAYGGHNLGDEAILRSMVKSIRAKRPSAEIQLLIDRRQASEEAIASYGRLLLRVLDRRSLPDLVRAARSKTLLLGGGQVISTHPKKLQAFQTVLVALNLLFRGRSYVVGGGVESIDDVVTRVFVRYGLRPVRSFALRDEHSLCLLQSAGVPACKLRLTADFVFSDSSSIGRDARASRQVVLAVERSPGYATHDLPTWTTVLAAIRERHRDCVIHVVAHDQRSQFDMGILRQLSECTELDPQVQFHTDIGLDALSSLYSSCQVVYSSRLHPLILGAVGGAGIASVGGRAKVASLLERLGVSDAGRAIAGTPVPLNPIVWPNPGRLEQLGLLSRQNLDPLDL